MAFIPATTIDWLADDQAFGVTLMGRQIALCLVDGEVHATDNVCPHQYALLSDGYLEDGCLECPLHQARFDVRTGRAIDGPVTTPLRTYPVRIEGDTVLVDPT